MTSPGQVTRTLTDLRGKRYGEVFLVRGGEEGLTAEVFNSFSLNDCPQDLWDKLDLAAIAEAEGALVAMANGPRYWLVDGIEKVGPEVPEVHDFGGILMARAAILHLGTAGFDPSPYNERRVARTAMFSFDAGSVVFELTDPKGSVYVMQSWCISVDPDLSEPDLADLGTRLDLPEGWAFSSRKLDETLQVMTTTTEAVVLQDDLKNSYCLAD
jgi:hypothetical protein